MYGVYGVYGAFSALDLETPLGGSRYSSSVLLGSTHTLGLLFRALFDFPKLCARVWDANGDVDMDF